MFTHAWISSCLYDTWMFIGQLRMLGLFECNNYAWSAPKMHFSISGIRVTLFGSHILIMSQHELTKAEFISVVENFRNSPLEEIYIWIILHPSRGWSWNKIPSGGVGWTDGPPANVIGRQCQSRVVADGWPGNSGKKPPHTYSPSKNARKNSQIYCILYESVSWICCRQICQLPSFIIGSV